MWFTACLFSLAAFAEGTELMDCEKNTVAVFQHYSHSVVYIHRLANVVKGSSIIKHVAAGAGSGIIWDNKGHIVTNYHVVKGADELSVSFGKTTVPAKVIGVEPRKDLAVLEINSPKAIAELAAFVPFKIAHTQDLLVGQQALAIGNPFGLDHTLTTGIISALGREVPGVGGVTIHDMIQTDASINPGNSGGPLLDSQGRLMGLNTVIYSNSGSSAGIGFAVPAEEIERMVPQLIKTGRVLMPGIGIKPVDARTAKRLGVSKGILIARIMPNTPAAKCHLQATHRDKFARLIRGDIIIAINGRPIDNYDMLYNYLSKFPVGQSINLTIKRDEKYRQYTLKTIDVSSF